MALTAFRASGTGPLCETSSAHIFLPQCSFGNGIAGRHRLQPEEDVELVRGARLELSRYHRITIGASSSSKMIGPA